MQTLSKQAQERLLEHLTAVYGEDQAASLIERLDQMAGEHIRKRLLVFGRVDQPPGRELTHRRDLVIVPMLAQRSLARHH